jgi:hydrogenase large subunit
VSRRIVGPFNRVEGDLEVHLEIDGNRVADAWVVSPLYRGFEHMLHGKNPLDAMVYTPRICGICSISQSAAAAAALARTQGLAAPPNGDLSRNLVLACENIADHLTHFYLFFMPDFCREIYRGEPWHAAAFDRFKAMKGEAVATFLQARAQFMHIMGLLAGKWPHSLAIQPGGTTRAIEPQEQARLVFILASFRRFLESALFGSPLEEIVALDSGQALCAWRQKDAAGRSDFGLFLKISEALSLQELGRADDRFLSYGAYRLGGEPLFAEGLFADGATASLDPDRIAEDHSHAWLAQKTAARHPYHGVTIPEADAADGYTWCKAPRLDGKVFEVGALARQIVDGHPLARDLLSTEGGNVHSRVVGRLLEVARTTIAMENWLRALKPKDPFCISQPIPDEAQGCGLIEAARGSLGHWVKIKKGRILNYQIISPTTWNFSPRDASGQPGALERALVNAPVRQGEADPIAVQHIVRSFDPCMVCTVH